MAKRDIAQGEELTHPYCGEDASNLALFWRFGFILKGNANDRLPLPEGMELLNRKRVSEACCSSCHLMSSDVIGRGVAAVSSGEGSDGEDRYSKEDERDRVTVLAWHCKKIVDACSAWLKDSEG